MRDSGQIDVVETMLLDSDDAPGGVLVYYADGDEEIIHVNRYIIDLFECSSLEELIEHTRGSFKSFVYDEDINVAEDSIWGQVDTSDNLDHLYYRIKTKTGRLVTVEDFGRLKKTEGARPVFHVFVVEVTQGYSFDWLTGLPDMARFHKLSRLAAETFKERGEQPTVVALDLVGLKAFNAEHGREEGDKILKAFGDALRTHFGNEACSRFAEDHFYAFAPAGNIDEQVQGVFDDFRNANDGLTLPVRAGAYTCRPGEDIVTIGADRAKIACDLDRKTWESHLVWFNDEMRDLELLRIYVLEHIDQAIEENWIRPHYQAVVRSTTSALCGEEALARWDDPKYGMLSPAQFVPVIEEAGLLYKLDLHIVDCVLEDIAAKREHGVGVVPVSVNLSKRDFRHFNVAEEISRRADAAGVPHGLLNVEITESAASSDVDYLREQVDLLHAAGFGVWLDDFGSGYSSLNTIQEYEFDVIKLDMQFVSSLDWSERARKLVFNTLKTAEHLGVDTLAEGVETEEQALFLATAGCDMLQGFHFARPMPVENIIGQFKRDEGNARNREEPEEGPYWSTVGRLSLTDPSANFGGVGIDGELVPEYPIAVMERRNGAWILLRSNSAYRDFLKRTGISSTINPALKTTPIEGPFDKEFFTAVDASMESGMWELIAGHLEIGAGFHLFVRHVAHTSEADAFMIAAAPTMLGTALGMYGDVPVAYAVFRVSLDEEASEVTDLEFIYANPVYCDWLNCSRDEVVGRSFFEVVKNADTLWLPYCYQAAVEGEDVSDIVYSPEIGHWISFNFSPSQLRNCCAFAFSVVDDEHREREEIIAGRDTSNLIIEMTNALNSEDDYETAMRGVLEAIGRITKSDRVCILEQGGRADGWTFEWCGKGAMFADAGTEHPTGQLLDDWIGLFAGESVRLTTNVSAATRDFTDLWSHCKQNHVDRLLTVPLRDARHIVGYLAATNYTFEEGLEIPRLLETVASFVAARIANHRLLEELEWAGLHDSLTGLLNRRGIDEKVPAYIKAHPEEPYALALLDIDDFKVTNDLYGHAVGDKALMTLARHLEAFFPEGSILGRNGGDELFVLLTGEHAENADNLFESFADIDRSFEFEGATYRATTSLGYACHPADVDSLAEAYACADQALYVAKLGGKSTSKRYSGQLMAQYRSQLGFTPWDISENVPGGVLVHRFGGEGEILFANDEIVDMLGCNGLSEFMAFTHGTVMGCICPEDRSRVFNEIVRQIGTDDVGTKAYVNYRIQTKGGELRNVAANGRLIEVDGVGKLYYVIILDRDERDEVLANRE